MGQPHKHPGPKTREERARYVKIVLTFVGKELGIPDVEESESRKEAIQAQMPEQRRSSA